MKEVIAVVRPSRAKLTKQRLAEKGFPAYTEARVSGRGKQAGLRYSGEGAAPNGTGGISFLPKRALSFFVNDKDVEPLIRLMMEANKTGEIGDGKIFVCPVETAVRIRTDEMNEAALVQG